MADPSLSHAGQRPEIVNETLPVGSAASVQAPLSLFVRIREHEATRRLVVLFILACAWEMYARYLNNDLMFPTFLETIRALVEVTLDGTLPNRIATSLQLLAFGYGIGIALASVLTVTAVSTRFGTDFLSTLTAMFNPLPAIALLPLALLWFGLGAGSIIFVVVHSVLWAVALNMHTGFLSVPETLRMTGRNVGLTGLRYVVGILIPAGFPSIVAGLKIGWAFAWRTLIAAELVFGVSARSGGLGWFIYENRNQLLTSYVFAGLLAVIIIGLLVESLIFRAIENYTVNRWGMQR